MIFCIINCWSFLIYVCLFFRNKRIFVLYVLNIKSYYKNCSSRSSNSIVYYSVVVVVVEVLVVYLFINGDIFK